MDPISNWIIYKRIGFFFFSFSEREFCPVFFYTIVGISWTTRLRHYKLQRLWITHSGGQWWWWMSTLKKITKQKKRKIHHHECEQLGFPHTMTPWHDTTLYFGEIILLDILPHHFLRYLTSMTSIYLTTFLLEYDSRTTKIPELDSS